MSADYGFDPVPQWYALRENEELVCLVYNDDISTNRVDHNARHYLGNWSAMIPFIERSITTITKSEYETYEILCDIPGLSMLEFEMQEKDREEKYQRMMDDAMRREFPNEYLSKWDKFWNWVWS
jgi:hypothetical protein